MYFSGFLRTGNCLQRKQKSYLFMIASPFNKQTNWFLWTFRARKKREMKSSVETFLWLSEF